MEKLKNFYEIIKRLIIIAGFVALMLFILNQVTDYINKERLLLKPCELCAKENERASYCLGYAPIKKIINVTKIKNLTLDS